MEYKSDNHRFDRAIATSPAGTTSSASRSRSATRGTLPVKIAITRNFDSPYWNLTRNGAIENYEKVDLDTVKFTIELMPAQQADVRIHADQLSRYAR